MRVTAIRRRLFNFLLVQVFNVKIFGEYTDMSKKLLLALLVGLFLVVGSAQAADVKIGYVDMRVVLDKLAKNDSQAKALKKKIAGLNSRMEANQKELLRLEESFTRDAAIMSDSEKESKQKAILKKRRNMKRSGEEFSDDLSFESNKVRSRLLKKVLEAVQSLAREEQYDVILNSAIYASDSVDITDKVTKRVR